MTCHSPQSHDYAFVHPLELLTYLFHTIHTKMSSTANELPPTALGGMKRRSSSFSQRVQVKGASIKVCPLSKPHRHLDEPVIASATSPRRGRAGKLDGDVIMANI
jgi:hypothetical protein